MDDTTYITLLPEESHRLKALASPALAMRLTSFDNGTSDRRFGLTHAEVRLLSSVVEQSGQADLVAIIAAAWEAAQSHETTGRSVVFKAQGIAKKAHAGQRRRNGLPYFTHPQTVAHLVGEESIAIAVAYLHDTLEDTKETPISLLQQGVPDTVVNAVLLLTRDKGMSYPQYLAQVAQCPLARRVKLGDLRHNLSDNPGDPAKYTDALRFLKGETP